MEILECLFAFAPLDISVTHEFKGFMSRVLFGFLFAPAAALAYYVAIEMNLHHKMLVVIGTALVHKHIAQTFLGILLDYLLKQGLVILAAVEIRVFQLFKNEFHNEFPRFFHAAVEKDRRNESFKSVG